MQQRVDEGLVTSADRGLKHPPLHAIPPSPAAERLSVERIDTTEAFLALEADWHALDALRDDRTPFTTFAWAAGWWKHFADHRWSVRDSLFVRAVRTGDGRLVAVAPLLLTERPSAGPLRARYLQFFGADANITELRGPVCDPRFKVEAHRALLEDLHAERARWDWMLWPVRVGSDAHRVLAPVLRNGASSAKRAYILDLPPTWEQFRAGLKRNIKESLRKCYNSLARDGHEFTFEVVRERAELRPALETFFRLHAARADAVGTVRHRNVFANPAEQRFLIDTCERLANEGTARVFQLRIAGAVVASRVGFALGDSLYLYYSGYDPAWGRYSVMTTVVAEAIKYAIAEGYRTVNLSTGSDISKTRWGPREVRYTEQVQLSPAPRARLVHAAYGLAMRARHSERFGLLAWRVFGRGAGARLRALFPLASTALTGEPAALEAAAYL